MLQSFKKLSWILLLVSGQQAAWAFSLAGPIANGGDAWQVNTIGYGLGGDIVAPKNIGEAYRLNCGTLYYAEDANFLNFFGSNGVVAIDQAFTIINTSLTNNALGTVDGYSTGLNEFPLNSLAVNYQASALSLTDLKSLTLAEMMEQMGLAEPDRWVWTLHDRYLPGGAQCPNYVYLVIQRNFDITPSPLNQIQYSSYVNGTLWTYLVQEFCKLPSPPTPVSYAMPVSVDPLADTFTAVADLGNNLFSAGTYFLGLTRDDMGGLRYLLTTNNIAYESPTTGGLLLSSTASGGLNYGEPFLLYTSNYTAFAQAALTNDPVTLSNLYPGLIITSSTRNFVKQTTITYVAYYTNLLGAASGSQTLVVAPVTNSFWVTTYSNTYANIIVPPGASISSSSVGSVYTVTVAPLSGAPVGSPLQTNTAISYIFQPNVPVGDYYINTNGCGTNLIVSILDTNTVSITNVIYATTNANGQSALQYIVTTSATHLYEAEAPICANSSGGGTATNSPGLYQGVGKVQFIKASYDSLLGQFFQPITNTYAMVRINNSQAINQTYQRVVTAPDYVFSAADLAPGPAGGIAGYGWTRNINFNQGNIGRGLAGPGTIEPGVTITFDKVGDAYINSSGGSELTQQSLVAWGSFDGSTNAPVVYPNGTSLANLANQVLVQVSPATLPNGTNGVAYPIQTFTITGGAFTAPYTWSLPAGSLPPGLTLNPDGTITSPTSNVTPGTPTLSGTFDFTLQLTDVNARSVQWNYSITIQ